jgi:sodium/bile acid cotransporter 7
MKLMSVSFFQRWFLVLLILVLTIGIVGWRALQPLSEWSGVRDGVVVLVMFSMSLPLAASTMWRSLQKPVAPLLAVLVSYVILPLFAWTISLSLPGDMGPGLQVAAVTPCTLASAAVWTRRAGGNDAVAILVTIFTNATCFLVAPLWLLVMVGTAVVDPVLSPERMIGQLALVVVLPMLVAQGVARHRGVWQWATRHATALGIVAQCGVLFMTLLGAIRTGMQLHERAGDVAVVDLAAMIVAVLVVHLTMVWLGIRLGSFCGCSPEDRIAIGFAGSQKTLVVGILLALNLKVSILPMVAYHCLQLIVDTLIADRYRGSFTKRE